jgi:hypothetical protein
MERNVNAKGGGMMMSNAVISHPVWGFGGSENSMLNTLCKVLRQK